MSERRQHASDRLLVNSRVALVVGFGSLLAIIAASGIDALRVLQNFRRNDDRIRNRFLFQNHLLNGIRSDVYLSGTYARDYLLEPSADRAEAYKSNLKDLRGRIDSALETYGRDAGSDRNFLELRTQLAQYWQSLEPIFRWDSNERRRQGYPFLRDELFPRRQSMLAIADRIASINEQQLNAGNSEVIGLLIRFRTRLVITLLAALALGAGMATFTVIHVLDLEKQANTRYSEAADARGQLKELSARLVQAQETERKALSRELHDEVGQALSAVLIELRNLSSGFATKSPEQSRNHLETIKGLVESAIRVVRNMALLLRPSMLDDLGLVPALKWQARELSRRTEIDVSVAAEIDSDLPDEYKTCIYRVVQEALHNCSTHARASIVRIRVQQQESRLVLSIQDDGCGFDARNVKGLGLLGIQERVTHLGGHCEVHSEPGGGTILAVELPFYDRKRSALEADSHPVG